MSKLKAGDYVLIEDFRFKPYKELWAKVELVKINGITTHFSTEYGAFIFHTGMRVISEDIKESPLFKALHEQV